jgi:hypothetical protein
VLRAGKPAWLRVRVARRDGSRTSAIRKPAAKITPEVPLAAIALKIPNARRAAG